MSMWEIIDSMTSLGRKNGVRRMFKGFCKLGALIFSPIFILGVMILAAPHVMVPFLAAIVMLLLPLKIIANLFK